MDPVWLSGLRDLRPCSSVLPRSSVEEKEDRSRGSSTLSRARLRRRRWMKTKSPRIEGETSPAPKVGMAPTVVSRLMKYGGVIAIPVYLAFAIASYLRTRRSHPSGIG